VTPKKIKGIVLLIITTLAIYYLFVMGFSLAIKLAVPNRPDCNPVYCQQVVSENTTCLIQTPGFSECVGVESYFYVLSAKVAYSILALSFAMAYYFSKRFYLSRILLVLIFFSSIFYAIRLAIGAADLTSSGIVTEFNKLGLNQPFIQKGAETIFKLFNPKF
jgi:hypothetical protein